MSRRIKRRVCQLETCSREMFGDLVLTCQTSPQVSPYICGEGPPVNSISSVPLTIDIMGKTDEIFRRNKCNNNNNDTDLERRRASDLVDSLLVEIYGNFHGSSHNGSDCNSTASLRSHKSLVVDVNVLRRKGLTELTSLISYLQLHVQRAGGVLLRRLKRRDALRRQQDAHCDVITGQLLKHYVVLMSGFFSTIKKAANAGSMVQRGNATTANTTAGVPEESETFRFTIQPSPGESGFSQWASAMKMVSQLSGGIPPEFRRRLWLTLADKHLAARGVNWPAVERSCFSEWSHPTDSELGVQIVKDLHRTGCSLFCGEDGQKNQALLKRVLLAYARWNKAVGYCQGFNMLAALILQVTDKSETDALKLMIYLIEGVLPDSYFADSLRGLSVDMAVFRELLRTKLPRLSRHLDALQNAARDGTTSYEPPLTNVFTMQWFLTLFCNCLPQPTVLRVWDLILLEGNEILLRTALAIWQTLQDRILGVRSADEFYCIMGVLTRELLEFGLLDANSLVKAVVAIGPLHELGNLRKHYLYNINPWGTPLTPSLYSSNAEKQLKVYPKERLVLDISVLKKQYAKLKQRQRQAHIIFSAAISRQPQSSPHPVAMNHLLLGKSALVPAKRLGPPKGSIPPVRAPPSTLLWKDAPKAGSSSSSSSDTELCDDPSPSSSSEEDEQLNETSTKKILAQDNPQVEDNIVEDLVSPVDVNFRSPPAIFSSQTTVDSFLPENELSLPLGDDIFDKVPPSTRIQMDFDIAKIEESDDDSVDFERFLEDRVRCLKEIDSSSVEIREDRAEFVRRNSERALQIIQENSLILHRIMQCQSRLSPSPPIVEEIATSLETELVEDFDKNKSDRSGDDYEDAPLSQCLTEHKDDALCYPVEHVSGPQTPEYGSRYTRILEKSRNLNERYNSLILNAAIKPSRPPTVVDPCALTTSIEVKSVGDVDSNSESALSTNLSQRELISKIDAISKFDSDLGSSIEAGLKRDCSTDFQNSVEVAKNNFSTDLNISLCKNSNNRLSPSSGQAESLHEDSSPQDLNIQLSRQSNQFSPLSLDKNCDFFWKESQSISSPESKWIRNNLSLSLTSSPSEYLSNNRRSPLSEPFSINLEAYPRNKNLETVSMPQDSDTKYTMGSTSTGRSPSLSITSNCQSANVQESDTKWTKSPTNSLHSPSVPVLVSVVKSPSKKKSDLVSPHPITQDPDKRTCIKQRSPTSDSAKSPNKVFNPFPISLSSRQNKEVPLRLGLYKK